MLKKMTTFLVATVLAAVVGVGSASAFPIIYSNPSIGTMDNKAPGAYSVNLYIDPAGADPLGIWGSFDTVIGTVGVGTTLTGWAPSAIVGGTILGVVAANTLTFQLGNTTASAWATPFMLGTITGTGVLGGTINTVVGTIQDHLFYEIPLEAAPIVTFVPEPGTLLLLVTGLTGLAVQGRRRS